MSSERTAAATGNVGELRFDPFAMLPFCGYHMGDYFAHWLELGRQADPAKLPRIYYVNWFRKNETGKFLWPGYGENSRVLKWIIERCEGRAQAVDTPIGRLPTRDALDVDGVEVDPADLEVLLNCNREAWLKDLPAIRKHYDRFGARLPGELREELEALDRRLRERA